MLLRAIIGDTKTESFEAFFFRSFQATKYGIIAIKHRFLIHLHWLGPSGVVKILAFQARVSTPPSGPFRLGFQHKPQGPTDVNL